MRRTFNMGMGLIAVVPEAKAALTALRAAGEDPVVVGYVDSIASLHG